MRSALILLACLTLTACLGLDKEDEFVAADEDYTRLSPALGGAAGNATGALTAACENEPDFGAVLQKNREEVMEHALCLCGNFKEVGNGLDTRSSSYLLGEDSSGAHVGINGGVDHVGNLNVRGSLNVARGLQGVGNLTVDQDLILGGSADITGNWNIGRDTWILGTLDAVGNVIIERDFYLGGALYIVGTADYEVGHRGFTYAGPPCPCGASQLIDVQAEVAAHRTANDNARLPSGVGNAELILEPGVYYFGSSSELVGNGRIVTRGHVELYVEGDIEAVGNLGLEPEPGSEVELWVSGKIDTVGNLNLGTSDARPRAFRLFMGGSGVSIVGNADFVGAIYAPQVDIDFVGNLTVHGSLFARSIKGTGNITIEHDTDLSTPQACADRMYPL